MPTGPAEVAVTQVEPPETPRLRAVVEDRQVSTLVKGGVASALERLLGQASISESSTGLPKGRISGTTGTSLSGHETASLPYCFRERHQWDRQPAGIADRCDSCPQPIDCTIWCGGSRRKQRRSRFRSSGRPGRAAAGRPEANRVEPSKGAIDHRVGQDDHRGKIGSEGLAELPEEDALERLLGLRGVGRWTAEYVLLRGLGHTHVFPGDDVGARNNLRRWLLVTKPMDYMSVHRMLKRWHPYGGLIYFHLLLDRLADAGFLREETLQSQIGQSGRTDDR